MDNGLAPIVINDDCIVVVHVYENTTDLITKLLCNTLDSNCNYDEIYQQSAKKYLDALKGNECDYFLKALIEECKRRLDD